MQLRWIQSLERFADRPYAVWLMAATAFADSSFFPIPPDVLMIPLALLRIEAVWRLAAICTAAAAAGSLVGYGIGWEFWEIVGARLVDLYGWTDQFTTFQDLFDVWGVWVIILKALTPIPFKVAAIAAGLADMNLWTFIGASTASRALHFLILAVLIRWLGPQLMVLVRKYETKAAAATMIVLLGVAVYFALPAASPEKRALHADPPVVSQD